MPPGRPCTRPQEWAVRSHQDGSVLVPLLRLQERVEITAPPVFRHVVAKLAVGVETCPLHEAAGLQRVRVQVLRVVVVPDAESYFYGFGIDERGAGCERYTCVSARGRRERREAGRVVSDVGSRNYIRDVAGTHAVVERGHELVVHGSRRSKRPPCSFTCTQNLSFVFPGPASFCSSRGLWLLQRLAPELREGRRDLRRPDGRIGVFSLGAAAAAPPAVWVAAPGSGPRAARGALSGPAACRMNRCPERPCPKSQGDALLRSALVHVVQGLKVGPGGPRTGPRPKRVGVMVGGACSICAAARSEASAYAS